MDNMLKIVLRDEKDLDRIDRAAEVIRAGGLVAFPTETVYGLGADALNSCAVGKIFWAKGRPPDNPLIVHVAGWEDVETLVVKPNPLAHRLADAFWPGPLTLILPRSSAVPEITTGGLETVAVRMPDHRVALRLIAAAGKPIAAPSANTSGRLSPTEARHVLRDLGDRLDALIDAGPTTVGVESTVLDLTGDLPTILRPGGLTAERLHSFLQREVGGRSLIIDPAARVEEYGVEADEDRRVLSPGMKYRHYAPEAELVLVEGGDPPARLREILDRARGYLEEGRTVGLLVTEQLAEEIQRQALGMVARVRLEILGDAEDPAAVAANLFSRLRRFHGQAVEVIIAEGIDDAGLGLAVMNRLRRAAGEHVRL